MTQITYTSFANKEAGTSVRAKINTLGANVATMSNEVISEIQTVNNTLTNYDTRLDTLETILSLLAIGTNSSLPSQTVSTTPSKLNWFTTQFAKIGTAITPNIVSNSIAISKTAVYTIGGTIILRAGNGDEIKIAMYVNGVATGSLSTAVGRGNTVDIPLNYFGAANLTTTDVVELYVSSTGTPITVTHSSFVIQEIKG